MTDTAESPRYPLLEALLRLRGLQLQAIYRINSTAAIFDVSKRTIQQWCRDGKLVTRDLPGRGRFLSEDLEMFLQNSLRVRQKAEYRDLLPDPNAPAHIPGRR